jgi:hypothetical protein
VLLSGLFHAWRTRKHVASSANSRLQQPVAALELFETLGHSSLVKGYPTSAERQPCENKAVAVRKRMIAAQLVFRKQLDWEHLRLQDFEQTPPTSYAWRIRLQRRWID